MAVKDTDEVASAERLRAAAWSLLGGVVSGIAGAFFYGFVGFLVGWLIGAAFLWFGVMKLADHAGRAAQTLYMSRGATTPASPDFSLGDALAARGRLGEAAAEFEQCAALYAADPEPRFRLARLFRDRLGEPESAVHWFRSVLDIPSVDAATEALAARELAELFIHRLDQRERALPVLARLADRQPVTPAGEWARARITEIKADMRAPS
jgi:hypothetical protein